MKSALVIYSGGLDTTICIPYLREQGYQRISTVTIDVGQPAADIEQAEARAAVLRTCHTTIDAKSEFASEYCMAAIGFNSDYFGYPLSTAIARPLIGKKAAEVAIAEGPFDAVVHGCTGKGNDQFRIELGLRTFAPGLTIVAPVRENNWTRSWELEYGERVGAPLGQSKDKIWSIDENLWGRSIEGGRLEEPDFVPPDEIFAWTKSLDDAISQPQSVQVEFVDGKPTAIDGKKMSPLELIRHANVLAGSHGIGRIDVMEDRMIGMKVRENYECPAATLLVTAHKELEALVCGPQERRFKRLVDQQWSDLVYQGLWFDPLTDDLTAFSDKVQKRVTGSVTLQLFKGGHKVLARSSPYALYSEATASFDDMSSFNQSEMAGMVKTHGLSSLLYQQLKKEHNL